MELKTLPDTTIRTMVRALLSEPETPENEKLLADLHEERTRRIGERIESESRIERRKRKRLDNGGTWK
jgi:hypothetical protein